MVPYSLHGMDSHNKELSLKFYAFLCDVIGTKEVVNKRRQIFVIKDNLDVERREDITELSSGSQGEGLDLTGSDYDLMIVHNRVQVFERLDQVKDTDGKIPLIMITENTKAGFTKLLMHNPQINSYFSDCIDRRAGFPYLSSKLLLQKFGAVINTHCPGDYVHGPCITRQDGRIDLAAISFRCAEWISQAVPWVIRSKHSWASDVVIGNILSFGVLFVPIGSKLSHDIDLEWRISFSYAEKQLIFCFNHVQLFCYALLKILLTDIVKKIFGDLLCSYFMKTIMFWLCEETELSYWRDENILSCFMACFRRLVYCVEHKTCLHYFIPENNLFENRFEKQHKKLLSTLHRLFDLGWTCLLQTKTLQSFRSYFEPQLTSKIPLSTFFKKLPDLHATKINNYEFTVLLKRFMYQTNRSKKGIDLYMYMLSSMCQSLAQNSCDEDLVQSNNRMLYKHLRPRISNLLIGVNHDAASGWLLLASFFLTTKQYKLFKTVIDHCFTKFTYERCELLLERDYLRLKRLMEKKDVIGLRFLKSYTINMVKIWGHFSIIPDELKALLDKDSYVFISSFVYANFLNFLFYHNIGDERQKRKAYRTFVLTCRKEIVLTKGRVHFTDNCQQIVDNLMHYNNCFN